MNIIAVRTEEEENFILLEKRSLIHRVTSPKQVTMIQQEVHDSQRSQICYVPKLKNISTQTPGFTALKEKIEHLHHV